MTEHVDEAVGAAVRAARGRRGMTLRELARLLEVSPGTVSAIENGKVGLTVLRLRQVAAALGVEPATLLSVSADEPEPAAFAPIDADAPWAVFDELPLDSVLTAAVQVFAETGYHGATMRVVAAEADLSVAGIYRYHRSKQHLLVALADAQLADLAWRVEAAAAQAADPVRAFADIVSAVVLGQVNRRDLSFIVETELRSLEDPDRTRIIAQRARVQQRMADAAVAAVAAGRFTATAPEAGAAAVLSLCRAIPFRFAGVEMPDGPALAAEYAGLALSMMGTIVQ
ncbi:TetR family transcriptional regulator [Gordonia phosphorivorans]|uniref:TetR family transcriptional regulator n=1 Tax=Gordonia phosphorivorans TaxID=1056982 RepID=A0ABV6H6G4_9ACTN